MQYLGEALLTDLVFTDSPKTTADLHIMIHVGR